MEPSPVGVRFGVRKGAKFLFACEVAPTAALPSGLQHHLVRADELALLRNAEITITKRLNIVEVDRMVACCRQHPPQALVAPIQGEASASDRTAFEDLARYLRQRERAGVGSISPGLLVMLIPLEDRDDFLRCQIVNTTTTVGEIGAQLTTVFEPAIDQRPSDAMLNSRPASPKRPRGTHTETTATERPQAIDNPIKEETETTVTRAARSTQCAGVRDEEATSAHDSHDPFDQLRQEHAAFNAFYHRVLLEWSTKPSDIESAQALRHHS